MKRRSLAIAQSEHLDARGLRAPSRDGAPIEFWGRFLRVLVEIGANVLPMWLLLRTSFRDKELESMTWVAVVPAKGTPHAKSRLVLPGMGPDIATAFVLDTVSALRSSAFVQDVLVVTADEDIAVAVQQLGAIVIQENPSAADEDPTAETDAAPQGPLNRAITQGIAAARNHAGEANLAIVTGDLPCLTTADIDAALILANEHRYSMIPDKDGTGTTTLLARAGEPLTPRFGMGSRVAHESNGHVCLDISPKSTVRHDVDTADDMTEALRLGVGPHTRALIARTSAAMAAED